MKSYTLPSDSFETCNMVDHIGTAENKAISLRAMLTAMHTSFKNNSFELNAEQSDKLSTFKINLDTLIKSAQNLQKMLP